MSRMVKDHVIRELTERLSGADGMVAVNFEGLTVEKSEEFRGLLAEQDLSMTVVKNSLAVKAAENVGMGDVSSILGGQIAFLYGGNEGVISVSRLLKDFTKKNKKIKIRGGVMDGTLLDEKNIKDLADMPTRTEMIGQVMAQILSAGGNIVGAMQGPGGVIAGCIEKHADNQEGGEAA